jgi:hypothetical protein
VVHRNEPADVFITDKGDVYTFDDWGREGRQIAVVRYSADGKKPKIFAMGDLFPAPRLPRSRGRIAHVDRSTGEEKGRMAYAVACPGLKCLLCQMSWADIWSSLATMLSTNRR